MTTISVYVPRVELSDIDHFDFVTQAFEKEYGEGSVKDVFFVLKCDGYYALIVRLECVTDEALSNIAVLNSGNVIPLNVDYWVGASVARSAEWRCMKTSIWQYDIGDRGIPWRSMRDEKNEHTIKE